MTCFLSYSWNVAEHGVKEQTNSKKKEKIMYENEFVFNIINWFNALHLYTKCSWQMN